MVTELHKKSSKAPAGFTFLLWVVAFFEPHHFSFSYSNTSTTLVIGTWNFILPNAKLKHHKQAATPVFLKLHEHTLEAVSKARYLGINIHQEINWDDHLIVICAKANKTSVFLRWNLKISSTSIKE